MNKLIVILDSIDLKLARVIKPIVVVLSLFIAFSMVFGIVSRSVFNTPLLGLEELILFSVMWLYMLGASLASREGSHLSADFINTYVTNKALKRNIHYLTLAISTIAILAFTVWSYSLFEWGITMRQSTPVFQLPMYLTQSSTFIASLLFLFYMFRDIVKEFQ